LKRIAKEKHYSDALMLLSTARNGWMRSSIRSMVMVEDQRLRANRLALLQAVLKEFSTIADFSEIVTEGKA